MRFRSLVVGDENEGGRIIGRNIVNFVIYLHNLFFFIIIHACFFNKMAALKIPFGPLLKL